jgi:phosphate starvation-inducible PhoH-like protein
MQLKSEEIDRIIITRPVVSVDEEIGFLPGDIIKKMDPWTKPIFDIFLEHYRKPELDLMLMNGKIEICPLAFMRGRTFKQAFIIADEMQNSSPNQMKMLTTRLGENSRMVITGDLQQTDILKENGLRDFVGRLDRFKNVTDIIKLVKLEADDIERSEVVRKVIDIYDDAPVVNKPNPVKTYSFDTTIYTNNNNKETGDAALIPIQHMTRNSLNKTILNTKNNTKTE